MNLKLDSNNRDFYFITLVSCIAIVTVTTQFVLPGPIRPGTWILFAYVIPIAACWYISVVVGPSVGMLPRVLSSLLQAGGLLLAMDSNRVLHRLSLPLEWQYAVLIMSMTGYIVGFSAGTHYWARQYALRNEENPEPRCDQCGYSLVGLTRPRCPECGTAFDESLLMRETQYRNGIVEGDQREKEKRWTRKGDESNY
jgi:hypothetical protein